MTIELNLSSLPELVIPTIVGAFLGNLSAVHTDKKRAGEDESQHKIKASTAILNSVIVGLGTVPWLLFFIGIPLIWHSIYQH